MLPDEVATRAGIKKRRRGRRVAIIGGVATLGALGLLYRQFSRMNRRLDEEQRLWESTWHSPSAASSTAAKTSEGASTTVPPPPTAPVAPVDAPVEPRPGTPESQEVDEARFGSLLGRDVVDITGDKVGEVDGIYYRKLEPKPEWVALNLGALDPKRVIVPLDAATIEERITVPYTKENITESPAVEAVVLDEAEEMQLYAHYGVRRMLPGIESQRSPEDEKLRLWTRVESLPSSE